MRLCSFAASALEARFRVEASHLSFLPGYVFLCVYLLSSILAFYPPTVLLRMIKDPNSSLYPPIRDLVLILFPFSTIS